MRVVFDTNIFISAFVIPGGNAEKAYLHAVRGAFELITSVAILTETANTLSTKFAWSGAEIEELLRTISTRATVLKTRPYIDVLRDEPDNRILECALLAEAGDQHLLSLKEYQGVAIIKLADFLALIEQT